MGSSARERKARGFGRCNAGIDQPPRAGEESTGGQVWQVLKNTAGRGFGNGASLAAGRERVERNSPARIELSRRRDPFMANDTYLFIDGEYLRQRHRAVMQAFFGVDGDLDVEPILHQAKARRAYFYDSVDETRRPDEPEYDWKNRVLERESFFSHVQSLSGFHVRRGTFTLGKKREQKEVDVQLTVDML